MKPKLTVTADFTEQFNAVIKRFKNDDVLVGIPEAKANRKPGEEGPPVNNAMLLAINNFGSPRDNIPARPVMEIGIRNAQDEIAEQFKQGAIQALSKGVSALEPTYNRIGIIASTSVKKAINAQNGFPPPAKATLRIREAAGFKGTKSLIVTAQMRNAITYVLRSKRNG